jgi:hypothetical protein
LGFLGDELLRGEALPKDEARGRDYMRRAAELGNPWACCEVGIACAAGTWMAKDFNAARKWLEQAAQAHAPFAAYWLRRLAFEKYGLLKWRDLVVGVVGYSLLAHHFLTEPFQFNLLAVLGFIGVLAGVTAVVTVIMVCAYPWSKSLEKQDEAEAETLGQIFDHLVRRKPASLLQIPAEDGCFLLPLLYLGITPWTAGVAALLFAAFHYPLFPWRYCLPKGVAYFLIALWLLPHGIWSAVAGHLVVDLIGIVLPALWRTRKNRVKPGGLQVGGSKAPLG